MPKIEQHHTITISVEKFLDQCSATELQEVDLLIQSNRYRVKMGYGKVSEVHIPEQNKEIGAFQVRCIACHRIFLSSKYEPSLCNQCLDDPGKLIKE